MESKEEKKNRCINVANNSINMHRQPIWSPHLQIGMWPWKWVPIFHLLKLWANHKYNQLSNYVCLLCFFFLSFVKYIFSVGLSFFIVYVRFTRAFAAHSEYWNELGQLVRWRLRAVATTKNAAAWLVEMKQKKNEFAWNSAMAIGTAPNRSTGRCAEPEIWLHSI